jgi:hypothetical protein
MVDIDRRVNGAPPPWEALTETQEHPPPMSEASIAGPWEALTETRERPPPMSETLMVGPLGGADGDPGAPTTYVGDIDGGPPWASVPI